MSNVTLRGDCPAPFYDASLFLPTGGFIDGRFCSPFGTADLVCCLPCPSTQWIYPDNFTTVNNAAGWLNVVGLILGLLILISYAALPLQYTRSHYLSICLVISIILINLGFVIPLAADPEKCYNEITPNDMYSSTTCAFSGAFIIAGGTTVVAWVLIRAFSMHLQIVWDIVPGRKFFLGAQFAGWAVPAAIFTAVITVTGVSFRFGDACHVNHDKSMVDFWAWLLAFSAIAVILQLTTVGYCAHVYLRNLWSGEEDASTVQSADGRSAHPSSVRTQTARAIYRRLKRVLWMQWRGMLIVTVLLVDVIFFCIVFVYLDDYSSNNSANFARAQPWLKCLVLTGGDKDSCLAQGQHWLVSEGTIAAVLILLSIAGIQGFMVLFRFSMITGWIELFRSKISPKQEFVSLDALHAPEQRPWTSQSGNMQSANGAMFEMQKPNKEYGVDVDARTVSPTATEMTSPADSYQTWQPQNYQVHAYHPQGRQPQAYQQPMAPAQSYNPHTYFNNARRTPEPGMHGQEYFVEPDVEARGHPASQSSVSSQGPFYSMAWDPTSTYANGGGLNMSPPEHDERMHYRM